MGKSPNLLSDPETGPLEWFLKGFTARDIADPLLSFDECSGIDEARRVVETTDADVLGVRRSGVVHRWISTKALSSNETDPIQREFTRGNVIQPYASLNEVTLSLRKEEFLFVHELGQIIAFISKSAFEKPPMRMWLFGIVTVSEQRVSQLIKHHYPDNGWQKFLSPGRLAKAHELQRLRLARGQRRTLLECLQLADKGQIVARDEALRDRTRFKSRKEVERFVQALQDLRNNLAHAQEISEDIDIIYELATNIHSIVGGNQPIEVPERNGS
jgi:hypothetical protein